MPKHTDTYARAYDCCDQVFIELGRFPTIDLIRERIGVNSPATIKKAMNEWTQHFAEKHFNQVNRPAIPAALVNAMEQAWQLAVAEAEKAYLEKEQGYQQTLAGCQVTLAEQQKEAAFLQQTLASARVQLEQSGQQAAVLQQQLEEQVQEAAHWREKAAASGKQVAETAARLQEQNERWQQQHDQDQAWFARRIMEEKQFVEEKYQDKLHRQNQQIAALSESEAGLRQVCAGLRQEQRRLEAALAESRQNRAQPFKFKPKEKANNKPGQGPGR